MKQLTTSSSTPETITGDLRCVSCGYNLKTLAVDSQCSECGRAIADTLAVWDAVSGEQGPFSSFRLISAGLVLTPTVAAAVCVLGVIGSWFLSSRGPMAVAFLTAFLLSVLYFFQTCAFVGVARSVFGKSTTLLGGIVAFLTFTAGFLGLVFVFIGGRGVLAITEFAILTSWSAHHARRVMSRLGPAALHRLAETTFRASMSTIVMIGLGLVMEFTLFTGTGPLDTMFRTRVEPWLAIIAGLATAILHATLMWRIASWLAGRPGSRGA